MVHFIVEVWLLDVCRAQINVNQDKVVSKSNKDSFSHDALLYLAGLEIFTVSYGAANEMCVKVQQQTEDLRGSIVTPDM